MIYRFEHDDQRLQKLTYMIHECFRVTDMTGGILNLFPWVRHFFPIASGYKPLLEAHKPLWTFLAEVVNENKAKHNNDRPKSFINSYLEKLSLKSQGEKNYDSFSGKFQFWGNFLVEKKMFRPDFFDIMNFS